MAVEEEKKCHVSNPYWSDKQSTLLQEHYTAAEWNGPISTEPVDYPLLHPSEMGHPTPRPFKRHGGSYKASAEATKHAGYHYIGRSDTRFIQLMECAQCAEYVLRDCRIDTPVDTDEKVIGLTVVNPNVALQDIKDWREKGKGKDKDKRRILELRSLLEHYGMEDLFKEHPEAMGRRFLYLDRLEKRDVVGYWPWKELEEIGDDWYEKVILPAFREHDRLYKLGRKVWGFRWRMEEETLAAKAIAERARNEAVELENEKQSVDSDSDLDSIAMRKEEAQNEFRKRKTICDHISSLWKASEVESCTSKKVRLANKWQRMKRRALFI